MKQQVTLQFPTIDILLAFTKAIHLSRFTLHSFTKAISAECSVEDILLARSHYGATVVEAREIDVSKAV